MLVQPEADSSAGKLVKCRGLDCMVVLWHLVLASKQVLFFPPVAVLLVCDTGAACVLVLPALVNC